MNISPKTVHALRKHGWDIVRVSQLLPVNASDQEILDLITLRLSVADPETVTQKLLELLPTMERVLQEGCAVTVEDILVRVRRLPIA